MMFRAFKTAFAYIVAEQLEYFYERKSCRGDFIFKATVIFW